MIFRVRVISGVNVRSGVSVPVNVGEIRGVAVDVMVGVLVTKENGEVEVRVGVLLCVRSIVGVNVMVGVEVEVNDWVEFVWSIVGVRVGVYCVGIATTGPKNSLL